MVSCQTMQDMYERILTNKIVHLKEIYNFDFDHFLCFNREKCYQKSKIQFSGQTLRHTKNMLRHKIVLFKKIYKSYFEHFLIKCIVFVLFVKNLIKNQNFNFPDKLCVGFLMSIGTGV